MAADISAYNRILKLNRVDTTNFRSNSIPTFVPSPTEDDYEVGYIQRYFIQSRNDENGYIYEVENYYYAEILSNPFFNGVVLRWKILGDREEVRIMNQKSVIYTSKDMKALPLYLPNYLQFHKERV
jgi:hypothetical protein